ncbi:3-dehydroquinate synthase [Oligoflexaceae bacterium]|nr:3-dehydroquinate synthase [Oligoflexaceae bacterium]
MLNVKWTMPDPVFLSPSNYHQIDFKPCHSAIDESMNWPSGTCSYLDYAFDAGLSRHCGWICKIDDPALFSASKVYKRGVYAGSNEFSKALNSSSSAYPIQIDRLINSDIFQQAGSLLIVDSNVEKAWASKLPKKRISVEALETLKNLETSASLSRKIRDESPKEIVIVGGGIVGDIAAFCAANLNIPFTLVPTTLLSMADACVGGKTGVNHPKFGKNQIGLFAFPTGVHIYTEWLESLDERHMKSGLAECIKHCLIDGNERLFSMLSSEKKLAGLSEWIGEVVEIKAKVVSRDPYEAGERATLNLGHTFGHALESLSQMQKPTDHILHGEAVAYGLLFSILLSRQQNTISAQKSQQLIGSLQKSSLDLSQKKFMNSFATRPEFSEIWQKILSDKKSQSAESSEWILLSERGISKNGDSFLFSIKKDVVKDVYEDFLKILL